MRRSNSLRSFSIPAANSLRTSWMTVATPGSASAIFCRRAF
jgi:hypothetical protein